MIPFPNKKYRIIYADPPWQFSSKQPIGDIFDKKIFVNLNKHYITQNNEWIKNLPVQKISKINCALFLWTTDAHLDVAVDVIKSWGFKYCTVGFVWKKETSKGLNACSMGFWTVKGCEICLIGSKGRINSFIVDRTVRQLVEEKKNRHSEKPNEVRKRIVQMFGNRSRIELFARKRFEGWDAWGNEV